MRQQAWLDAAPRHKGKAPDKQNRYQSFVHRNGYAPGMPDIGWGDHVLADFFECGPVLEAGEGKVPLSYSEIACWAVLTGAEVTPWQANAMQHLSRVYLSQFYAAANPSCPQPWTDGFVDREKVASATKGLFAKIAQAQQKKRGG